MTPSPFNDDIMAKAYQELLLPVIFDPWGRVLIGKAGLKPGDHVLDVATGPGTLARLVAETLGPRSRVVGVDISPQMLAQAKAASPVENGAELAFLEAPAETLPFPEAHFDAVLCQQGLHFFSDQLGALKEMRRVLQPGGRLALAMWSDDIGDAVESTLAQPPPRTVRGWLDKPRLSGLLADAGFANPVVSEETLTVVLERGLPQALECVIGTTSGPVIRAMNAEERVRFERKLSENLVPWTKGQAIYAPARALVAVAAKP
jgi:ubiquinone/menaquinone biosynthesis C-methylase UbiE